MNLLACLALAQAHERENQAPSKHPARKPSGALFLNSGLDSRYHSEGRDALDGDSLWRSSLEWSQEWMSLGVWYGNSPDQSYDELQLSAALRQSFGAFDTYVGYTHYRFPSDGAHDHELGLGFALTELALDLELALDAYHSFEADGFFLEMAASREWQLAGNWVTDLSIIFGMNQGYVADGHDGANHVAASWGLSYALTESLSVGGHATYSWAINRKTGAPDDVSLKDFFHAGMGLEWSF